MLTQPRLLTHFSAPDGSGAEFSVAEGRFFQRDSENQHPP